MIKKCYRLWVDHQFLNDEFKGNGGKDVKMYNYLYDIDEDCYTKKEWNDTAKGYVDDFNEEFDTAYTVEDFFGTVDSTPGWVYCTKCGESFWADQDHECEV